MHPRTAVTLANLERASWFSRVGVQDATAAIVLGSWAEAIEQCTSKEWENLCLEAMNQYRERLVERSSERFEKWNVLVDELKKTTIPFVRRKIERVSRLHKLPRAFEAAVQWDILGVCMESEYADVYPPGFYGSNAYWYIKGHFPCGWRGEFPKGQLVVY